jgi:Fe2+ or Zn2+ uptake regulation protein
MLVQIDNLPQYLKAAGIKPSVQRLRIFDYLVHSTDHPTVDTIFIALSPELSTLSKTTVYNTLKIFQQYGIVSVINIEDHETRYDADTRFHGHFKCNQCDDVQDFIVDQEQPIIASLQQHLIVESHYYLKGICPKCRLDQNKYNQNQLN